MQLAISLLGGRGFCAGFDLSRGTRHAPPGRMKLALPGGFRLPLGGARGRMRLRPQAGWLVPALAIAAMLIALGSGPPSERRALRALPDEQRSVLLSRTMDDLRSFCGDGRPETLADHCRELASFASRFDDCSGECEALVRRQLAPAPTR